MSNSREASVQIPFFNIIGYAFLVFLYFPLVFLVFFSFNKSRSISVFESFSLVWYEKALANSFLLDALKTSLIVALTSAFTGTVLATLAAIAMVRGEKFRGKMGFITLINMPLMLPEIVTAVSTLSFFVLIGLKLGIINVILAHVVFCVPFAFMSIYPRIQGMSVSFENAAYDLYANTWQMYTKVLIPMLFPGILSGFMMAFVVSMDDFIITQMVAEPGTTTLPLYIYGMARVGFTPELNAISTLVLVLSAVVVFVFGRRGVAGAS